MCGLPGREASLGEHGVIDGGEHLCCRVSRWRDFAIDGLDYLSVVLSGGFSFGATIARAGVGNL